MVKFRLRDGTGEVRLRWLVEDVDRHGNVRVYVRRPGHRKARLRETPGTDAFMEEYRRAVEHATAGDRRDGSKPPKGSFRALCQAYYASREFKALDSSTQAWRRRHLDLICYKRGNKPVALLEPRHIKKLRDELADQPGAANNRLKAMKALFAWGIGNGGWQSDPGH